MSDDQLWYLLLGSALLALLIFLIAKHCIRRYDDMFERFIEFNNNIMVITDEEEILNMNSAGLIFFGFRTLTELKKEHKYIDKFFEEIVEYGRSRRVNGKKWVIDKKNFGVDILVKMNYRDEVPSVIDQFFYLRVSKIKANKYLLTFNNVTGLVREKVTIKQQAEHDPLTGLYNRLKFNALFDQMFDRGMRFDENFCVILFDIDHFKRINDTKGHAVGDSVLRELARLTKLQMRKNDVIARWGGEEFIILVPFMTDIQAKKFADRIRKEIESYHFNYMDGKVTCSFGVTQYRTEDTKQAIFERADEALYNAKHKGRNQVVAIK